MCLCVVQKYTEYTLYIHNTYIKKLFLSLYKNIEREPKIKPLVGWRILVCIS